MLGGWGERNPVHVFVWATVKSLFTICDSIEDKQQQNWATKKQGYFYQENTQVQRNKYILKSI